ncbi:hypothetical protein Hanom_Chr06g00528531 [Helianthus anomalus]
MASLVWPLRTRHVTLLARPTPGFKPKPQAPCPNPSPPGVVAWAFSPNPRPNLSPISHSLISFTTNLYVFKFLRFGF